MQFPITLILFIFLLGLTVCELSCNDDTVSVCSIKPNLKVNVKKEIPKLQTQAKAQKTEYMESKLITLKEDAVKLQDSIVKQTLEIIKEYSPFNTKFNKPKPKKVSDSELKARRTQLYSLFLVPYKLVEKVSSLLKLLSYYFYKLIYKASYSLFYFIYTILSKLGKLGYTILFGWPYRLVRYIYFKYGFILSFFFVAAVSGISAGLFFTLITEGLSNLMIKYVLPKKEKSEG